MPKIKYQDYNFRLASLAVIEQANRIVAFYQQQGLDLTLRQVYYQFVTRDYFPNDRWWWWDANKSKWIADPLHTNVRSNTA
jgi:hypothetical protein